MENVAHALIGRRIGQLEAFRAVGPRAALVGLVAANVPDLDVLVYAIDRDVGTWEHRGFTHSVLGWPVLALGGALLSWRWLRTGRYRDHAALWVAGIASHAVLDVPTSWGTQLLWPSDRRFGLELIFIVDPLFWVTLGLLPWWLVRRGRATGFGARAGIMALACWYAVAAAGKGLALRQAPEVVEAVPAPSAPLHWTAFTVPGPGDDEVRRYWLTPWSCTPAGTFRAPQGSGWDAVVATYAGERDAWMSIAPVLLRDDVRDGAGDLVVVDLAFSNWLEPEGFRFGHRYTLGGGAVLSRTGDAGALSAEPSD